MQMIFNMIVTKFIISRQEWLDFLKYFFIWVTQNKTVFVNYVQKIAKKVPKRRCKYWPQFVVAAVWWIELSRLNKGNWEALGSRA